MKKTNHDKFNTEVQTALQFLKKGKTILYPTDTIWGIGCDARNIDAVERIYVLKKRPRKMPLLLLVSSVDMLLKYVTNVHPRVENLLLLNNKPLTIIYKDTQNLPKEILHQDGSIGIRVVHHDFCTPLIKALKYPIVSTSANIHGEPTPLTYDKISTDVTQAIDHVVDCNVPTPTTKKASPIATFDSDGELTFLR